MSDKLTKLQLKYLLSYYFIAEKKHIQLNVKDNVFIQYFEMDGFLKEIKGTITKKTNSVVRQIKIFDSVKEYSVSISLHSPLIFEIFFVKSDSEEVN